MRYFLLLLLLLTRRGAAQEVQCESKYKDGVLVSSCDSKGYHSSMYCSDGKCKYSSGVTLDSHIEANLPEFEKQKKEAQERMDRSERKARQELCLSGLLPIGECVKLLPFVSRHSFLEAPVADLRIVNKGERR